MQVGDTPLMRAVREAVAPLMPRLQEAFEAGVDYGRSQTDYFRTQFDNLEIAPDPWHFSGCVRVYVKQFLTEYGLRVENYRLDSLANNGLRFVTQGWDIRTRRSSRDGGMPRLAQTEPILAFCQLMLPQEFERVSTQLLLPGALGTAQRRNLWLLWHATPACDEYLGLSVVYQLAGASAQPTIVGRLDFPARSTLFQSPAQLERDLEYVGEVELEPADLGDLEMELRQESDENEDITGQADGQAE